MKTTNDYAFGNLITALRTERGFSQFQLGHLLGVSDKAVSKWENGNAKPRIATCYRLADILGVSLDELLSPSGKHLVPMSEVNPDPDEKEFSRIAEDKYMSTRIDQAPKKRVELHMHTSMSASDGIVSAYDLIKRVKDWEMPAIAITDYCNTRAFPMCTRESKRCQQKVILGCEVLMISTPDAAVETGVHVMLLVRNREGLVNLNKLLTLSYTTYYHGVPCMPREMIQQHRQGLLIGSSCDNGEIIHLLKSGAATPLLKERVAFYDYLEVQPVDNELSAEEDSAHQREALEEYILKTIQLGNKANIPVVAVSNGRFLDLEDGLSRAVLQYSAGFLNAEVQPPYYLRTTEEMITSFSFLGSDLAEDIVVHATNLLASLVDEQVDLFPTQTNSAETVLPVMPEAEQHIRNLAIAKAHEIYGEALPELISVRMEKEFSFIAKQNGWPILEIAWLAVKESQNAGYPVMSRGSVGSSLIAYLVEVTDINPLPPHYICGECHYTQFADPFHSDCGVDLPEKVCPCCGIPLRRDGFNIPAETFFGVDGTRQMDIDLNFSGEAQGHVHKYIRDYFGADHVFRPGTLSGMAEFSAEEETAQYARDHQMDADSPTMKRISQQLLGTIKGVSQHPGGLFFVPTPYTVNDFTPIQYLSDDQHAYPISHYDFNSMYDRLLKMDFLGHDDPTMLKALKQRTGIDPKEIDLHDEKVLSLFQSPDALGVPGKDIFSSTGTLGIPEFGTEFVRGMLQEIKPASMEDLIRVSGLSHGADVWIDNVRNILQDHVAPLYDCPATRDDITNYLTRQGMPFNDAFTISEFVRKGKASIGLKPEMQSVLQHACIPEWYIRSCCKIKYLFPRAHAVSYVSSSIRMAWYKMYYPEAFYATWFSVRGDYLEQSDLSMDLIQLRKAILSIRRELQSLSENDDLKFFYHSSYEERSQKKTRMTSLMLLLEMNLRGYKLPDDFCQS